MTKVDNSDESITIEIIVPGERKDLDQKVSFTGPTEDDVQRQINEYLDKEYPEELDPVD